MFLKACTDHTKGGCMESYQSTDKVYLAGSTVGPGRTGGTPCLLAEDGALCSEDVKKNSIYDNFNW